MADLEEETVEYTKNFEIEIGQLFTTLVSSSGVRSWTPCMASRDALDTIYTHKNTLPSNSVSLSDNALKVNKLH